MTRLLHRDTWYKEIRFIKEEDLEKVVVKNSKLIFGEKTIYFDIKKRIKSKKGDILSIPDGYILSFEGSKPRLFIIENELSTHDTYKHIGIQLWNFASSFKEGDRKVKNFLLDTIKNNKTIQNEILKFIKNTPFPNFSELLDYVVFDQPYGFIVVIDEITEELNFALKQLANKPDILELKKYVNKDNDKDIMYRFSPFQEEVKESLSKQVKDISDFDTIVCPAKEEGFKDVFLGEEKWYAIRISPSMIPQIKYIAMYEVAPISAIRWIGEVREINPYKDTGKYEVVLTRKWKLPKPIKLDKEGMKKVPYSPRYTKFELIKKAKNISEVFN